MPHSATPTSATPTADLQSVLAPLDGALDRVGEVYREILAGASPESQDMVRHAARFNGKRLRPALTCVAARLSGVGTEAAAGEDTAEDVARCAAVVELIHTATLVHDDILDSAAVRRRVATVNVRWGNHAAVLVGDVLFSKAYRAAAYLDDPFASRYLSDIVSQVLEGEIHQDHVSHNPLLGEEEYREIIRGKTAALYEASLVVGAHYGGAGEELKGLLGAFGHHIGMAFQIIDDRLDVTGDEATVGKSLGTDMSEGKMTLPLILWRDGCAPEGREQALARIRHAWSCDEGAHDLARELQSSGALERTDVAAQAEIDRAFACLGGVPEGANRDLLATIAGFVVRRSL